MATVSAQRLAEVFVEVADTLIDEFDLIDFLHLLAVRTAEVLGAPAVGLLLADQRGKLGFLAASDENARLLEVFQVQADEGPCLEAFRTGVPIVNVDLPAAGARWPAFAPRAAEAGFRSVHAFPLRLRAEVIGALNVFGADTGSRLDSEDRKIVQALADVATIGLLQERAIHRGEILTEQLQAALNSRVVIEQAKGAIAQASGISVDEAFHQMRSYARRNGRGLSEVARRVLTDPASVPGLLDTSPKG